MCFCRLERDDETFRRTAAKKSGVIPDIAPDIKNTPVATDIADAPPFGLHLTIRIITPHMGVIRTEPNWFSLRNHRPDRSQIKLNSRGRSFNIQTRLRFGGALLFKIRSVLWSRARRRAEEGLYNVPDRSPHLFPPLS